MVCSGHRLHPKTKVAYSVGFGGMGLMLVSFVGEKPETIYGEVTNHPYDFNTRPTQYVDLRDAAYLLGLEFIDAEVSSDV